MKSKFNLATVEPDSAAVFSIALSLWEICERQSRETGFNISECYKGVDQFMREVMRIADRRSYEQVLDLAQKIAPSIRFPVSPTFTTKYEN
jgi:hypothetical protein